MDELSPRSNWALLWTPLAILLMAPLAILFAVAYYLVAVVSLVRHVFAALFRFKSVSASERTLAYQPPHRFEEKTVHDIK